MSTLRVDNLVRTDGTSMDVGNSRLLADLEALTGTDGQQVTTSGRTAIGDGGEGLWAWDDSILVATFSADTTKRDYAYADGKATDGCWVRVLSSDIPTSGKVATWDGMLLVDVRTFGAIGDGLADESVVIQAAYDYAASVSRGLHFPAGTYKCSVLFNKGIEVTGDGSEHTFFTKVTGAAHVISISSADALLEGTKLKGITITGDSLGTGLILGGSGAGNLGILYNGIIEDVAVRYFDTCIYVSAMLSTTMLNVTAEYGATYGINFRNEGPNTTNTMIGCRFRQCLIGMFIGALEVSSFIGCVFESNTDIGVRIISSTSNSATSLKFNTCWFENNGHTPSGTLAGLESSLLLDMNSTIGTTFSQNIEFNKCQFSSPAGIYDVYANRAMKVYFNECAFTDFTSTNFFYTSGIAIGEIYLNNCGQRLTVPTVAMYAAFPALTAGVTANIWSGFKYTFVDRTGLTRTNIPTLLTLTNLSSATNIPIDGITEIYANTTDGNVAIETLISDDYTIGQTIVIIKKQAANSLTLTFNVPVGGIITPTGLDVVITNISVVTIVFNGSQWNVQV